MLTGLLGLVVLTAGTPAATTSESEPASSPEVSASEQPETETTGTDVSLLLIMDASGSMQAAAGGGQTRIAAAKAALREVVGALPDGAPTGLRVYGHRIPNTATAEEGCQDTELIQPVEPLDRQAMLDAIEQFDATGYTPIGLSLQEAAQDLPETGQRRIVLVSDGIDTCAPPDPCAVARELAAQGIDLRIETIGFQVDPAAREQLQCIAEATGGTYRDAPDASSLSAELRALSVRAFRDFVARGTPVEGTPEPGDAPPLSEGTSVDEITADTQKWYVVDVAAGQRATVAATMVGVRDGPRAQGGIFRIRHMAAGDPGRQCGVDLVTTPGRTVETVSSSTPELTPDGPPCRTAGEVPVIVDLDGDGELGTQSYALEIEVSIEGEPAPSPTPSPSPEVTVTEDPTPEPTPTGQAAEPASEPPQDPQEAAAVAEPGSTPLRWLLFAVGGLVLGAAAAGVATRRR